MKALRDGRPRSSRPRSILFNSGEVNLVGIAVDFSLRDFVATAMLYTCLYTYKEVAATGTVHDPDMGFASWVCARCDKPFKTFPRVR